MPVDKNMTVLVVDDMPAMRKVLSTILTSTFGITNILHASDGKEGIKAMEAAGGMIKLVLCDWNMPGMNGMDFYKHLRGIPDFKDTPFVMITAESDKAHVMTALKAGVSNYILKPFDSNDIKMRIEKVLGK